MTDAQYLVRGHTGLLHFGKELRCFGCFTAADTGIDHRGVSVYGRLQIPPLQTTERLQHCRQVLALGVLNVVRVRNTDD